MAHHYTTYAIFSRTSPEAPHPEQTRIVRYLAQRYPALRPVATTEADLLLVFGGDGTLLETVRSRTRCDQHLLAFNTGHTGFLATVRDYTRFFETIDHALSGSLIHMHVPVMRAVHHSGEMERVLYAVNDMVIDCVMTWLTLRIDIVQGALATFVKEVRGSGLCLFSSIGSTTAMAAHFQAPRMDPDVRAFYMKGVNDLSAPANGMLLSGAADRRIRITLTEIQPNLGIPMQHRYPPSLFLDGVHAGVLSVGDVFDVHYLEESSILLRLPEELHWDRVRALRY